MPSDKILLSYIKEAKKLNDEGVKLPAKKIVTGKKVVSVPNYFIKVLKKNKTALSVFENFSPSHKKEYTEWITEAKTDETRSKRIAAAIDWLSEGKPRNWKYIKK